MRGRVQLISLAFLVLSFFTEAAFAQKDSDRYFAYAKKIIENSNLQIDSTDNSGYSLKKKHVKRIAKIAISQKFGRLIIWKEKPYHIIKYNNYWVVIGHKHNKNRKGGVATVIINDKNMCVEKAFHGK